MNATTNKTTTPTISGDNAPMTFEQLYVECWRYCRGIVTWKAHGLSDETADDLVSDSYESLYRNWHTVEGKPANQQKMYLARAVANRVNDYLRRLKLERATRIEESYLEMLAVTSAAKSLGSSAFGSARNDALSVLAYIASGRTDGTDSPERVYLAREELRETIAACAFTHMDAKATQRVRQTLLADAMGYTQPAIAHAQGRSPSAIKMELMRAKERLGVKEPSSATARTPRIRKQRMEVAA